jgi:hypothetical protein
VLIYNLVEGIFFAKLVANLGGRTAEIDARTSDAVAIAVRFNCPIYCFEFILDAAGVNSEDDIQELDMEESDIEMERITALTDPSGPSVEELQNQLENAINQEDYEKASKIRDEIKRRGEGNESRS